MCLKRHAHWFPGACATICKSRSKTPESRSISPRLDISTWILAFSTRNLAISTQIRVRVCTGRYRQKLRLFREIALARPSLVPASRFVDHRTGFGEAHLSSLGCLAPGRPKKSYGRFSVFRPENGRVHKSEQMAVARPPQVRSV